MRTPTDKFMICEKTEPMITVICKEGMKKMEMNLSSPSSDTTHKDKMMNMKTGMLDEFPE